jgi:hypothetical protein
VTADIPDQGTESCLVKVSFELVEHVVVCSRAVGKHHQVIRLAVSHPSVFALPDIR